jgi:beta-galactosidase
VAWGQLAASKRQPVAAAGGERPFHRIDGGPGRLAFGPAVFDARTGAPMQIGQLPVRGFRLDVWRAPTDNEQTPGWPVGTRPGPLWRALGLDRMQHRPDKVTVEDGALVVRSRVAPAASQVGLAAEYRWTAAGDRITVTVSVSPEGDWQVPLPKLGVRFGIPAGYGRVTWFGGGPGEAYPDTRAAARLGRYHADVDDLQTPYVRPQENGARADVRWVELAGGAAVAGGSAADGPAAGATAAGGAGEGTAAPGGLRIEAEPACWFTARRWSTEQLDAALHRTDLTPGDTVWLHLDHGQQGIGSQSCGPGVLPEYRLTAAPATFSFTFTPLAPGPTGSG